MQEGKSKKATLGARVEALEARVSRLEAGAVPADDADLLEATAIRALLSPGSDTASAPAEPAAEPEPEEEPEPSPDWPPAVADALWIEALAVPETFQGKPVVFAAEPVDEPAVALLLSRIGTIVPVVGRPIEDMVPRVREVFGAAA